MVKTVLYMQLTKSAEKEWKDHSDLIFEPLFIDGQNVPRTSINTQYRDHTKGLSSDPDYVCDVQSTAYWKYEFTYDLNQDGYHIAILYWETSYRDQWGEPHTIRQDIGPLMLRGEERLDLDLSRIKSGKPLGMEKSQKKETINADKVFGTGDVSTPFSFTVNKLFFSINDIQGDDCSQKHHFKFVIELDDDPKYYLGGSPSERSLTLENDAYISGYSDLIFNFTAKIHVPMVEKTKGLFSKKTETVPAVMKALIQLYIDGKPVGKKVKIKLNTSHSHQHAFF